MAEQRKTGCCEMETDVWACGTTDVLVLTQVHPAAGEAVLRYVCNVCAAQYGDDDDFARFGEDK